MLQLNLSEAEIKELIYGRFHYPCPIVQKRIQAVYMRASTNLSTLMVGISSGLHEQSVRHWIKVYQTGGFKSLCQVNYGTNKSELDAHSTSILKSFNDKPPMSANEAKLRIEKL